MQEEDWWVSGKLCSGIKKSGSLCCIYYDKRKLKEKMEEIQGLKLHGQFGRDANGKKPEGAWNWLRKGNLLTDTEGLLLAA